MQRKIKSENSIHNEIHMTTYKHRNVFIMFIHGLYLHVQIYKIKGIPTNWPPLEAPNM
jgi:hypothetical protein